MDKFAYFNPLEPGETAPPPPPPLSDALRDLWSSLWSDSTALLGSYCEQGLTGWLQEPLNALNVWSSLLFLLAGFAAFAACRSKAVRRATGSSIDRTRLMLCLDLSAIGVASWTFHASGWALFAFLDVATIFVFTVRTSFALLTRGLALSALQAFFVVVALFAVAPLFSYLPLLDDDLTGNHFYFSPILALGLVVLLLRRRARLVGDPDMLRSSAGLAAAFAVLLVSLTMRTLDLPLCNAWVYGTHFLWHTLTALALYLVIVFLPKQPSQT